MPITLLEMVSFTFHYKAERDRNAGGTGSGIGTYESNSCGNNTLVLEQRTRDL